MDIQTPPTVVQPSTSEDSHTNPLQGTNQPEDNDQLYGNNEPGGGASAVVAIAAGTAGGVVGLILVLSLFTCVICLCRQVQIQVHFCQREKSEEEKPPCNCNAIAMEMHLQTNKAYAINDELIQKADDDNMCLNQAYGEIKPWHQVQNERAEDPMPNDAMYNGGNYMHGHMDLPPGYGLPNQQQNWPTQQNRPSVDLTYEYIS